MSLSQSMVNQVRGAIRGDGTLDEHELRSLIQKALSQTGGLVPEISQALIYIRWHFWKSADAGARQLLDGFVEAAFGDNINFYFWAADVFAPNGAYPPPPGSPPPPRVGHDNLLVGRWHHESRLSNDSPFSQSSILIARYRTFGRDGRFAESSSAAASSNHFGSDGTWTGSTSALTDLSAAERGRWATAHSTLWLRWDDGGSATCGYEAARGSLLLTLRDGNQLWQQ